ncbi:sulfite exporter TauE/SafE family protein, partial [Aeromicrobium sp.]|uniref:sulfite exporter TauE/SafE family protein n=1 Tax=Aeromicrobium sp. TaxID=1871063 RepID=UPI0028A5CB26
MGAETVLVVGVLAFATSALTAVLGFGGGVVLLAMLLTVVDPLVAIPLHAAIQVVSNGTRTIVRRRDVDWRVVGWTSVLLLPAGALTLPLAQRAPEAALQALIAIAVLAATWLPERLDRPLRPPTRRGWLGLG